LRRPRESTALAGWPHHQAFPPVPRATPPVPGGCGEIIIAGLEALDGLGAGEEKGPHSPPATGSVRGLHRPPGTRSLAAPLRSAGQTAGPCRCGGGSRCSRCGRLAPSSAAARRAPPARSPPARPPPPGPDRACAAAKGWRFRGERPPAGLVPRGGSCLRRLPGPKLRAGAVPLRAGQAAAGQAARRPPPSRGLQSCAGR
jgi:hypothetical protein